MKRHDEKIRRNLWALTMATSLSAASIASFSAAYAAPGDPLAEYSELSQAARNSFELSAVEAGRAMQRIAAARLAIFDGQPEDGAALVAVAHKDLDKARESLHVFNVVAGREENDQSTFVPFATTIVFSEEFVPDEKTQKAVDEANTHMANGNSDQAIEVLKTAKVDVLLAAQMIPVAESIEHMQEAERLFASENYYAASQALKSIVDSAKTETYGMHHVLTK